MNDESGSGSAQIARHIAQSRYENLPGTTIAAAKRAILDVKSFMASGTSEDVLPFVDLARALGGSAQATILGFRERVSAPMAAFANGAMAHALDFEDAFDAAPVIPMPLLPALLGAAELRLRWQARFHPAVATGCDLVCRVALSLRRPMENGVGIRHPSWRVRRNAAVSRAL